MYWPSIKKLKKINLLELFHGPTLAFKDIAMQFIGNLYDFYIKNNNQNINIIVATSGDTGAAAIDAIKGKKNMNIFDRDVITILHEKRGKIPPISALIQFFIFADLDYILYLKTFVDFFMVSEELAGTESAMKPRKYGSKVEPQRRDMEVK